MPAGDDLSSYAALAAPVIDRVFRTAMGKLKEFGGYDLSQRFGGHDRLGPTIEFRTALAWPGRSVTWSQFTAVKRYTDTTDARAAVLAAPALECDDRGFRAGSEARAFLGELWAMQDKVLPDVWDRHDERVWRLLPLTGRLLEAAGDTGWLAFDAMAPPYEPPRATPATILFNRLDALRYHRADAHAAAWLALGMTADEVRDLPSGPRRDAIEAATNAADAPPYTALKRTERDQFLDELSALPA